MNTKPGYVIAAVAILVLGAHVLATLGASPTVRLRDCGIVAWSIILAVSWIVGGPDSFRYGSFGLRRIRDQNAGDVHCHAGLWHLAFDARTTKSASSELP